MQDSRPARAAGDGQHEHHDWPPHHTASDLQGHCHHVCLLL